MTLPQDNNEIKEFFKTEGLEKVLSNDPNITISDLDDGQVERLLKLTQKVADCNVIAAPKVLVYDGEDATVRVQKTVRYNKESQDDVNEVKVGITIKVKPVLRDEGKNILLALEYEHSNLLGFEKEEPIIGKVGVQTHILMANGQNILLGGQKQKITKEENGRKVPKRLLYLIKAEKIEKRK